MPRLNQSAFQIPLNFDLEDLGVGFDDSVNTGRAQGRYCQILERRWEIFPYINENLVFISLVNCLFSPGI